MKLSKQSSDAVSIMLFCHGSPEPLLKVGYIAEELGLTKQMALKLSNRLARADLLMTVRGPKGGVQLTDQAKDLALGQIVRRLETVLQAGESDARAHPFDTYFDEAFEAFLDVLDQHKLSDLAARNQAKPKAARRKAKSAPRNTAKSKPTTTTSISAA